MKNYRKFAKKITEFQQIPESGEEFPKFREFWRIVGKKKLDKELDKKLEN